MIGEIILSQSGRYIGTVTDIIEYGTDESRIIVNDDYEIMMYDVKEVVINLSNPCYPEAYIVVY